MKHLAAGLLIAALVVLAYRPSLGHVPRADHWWYLLQTAHDDDFGSAFARTYSYNRTVASGDYGLFRPGLFALLAAEKAAFGHDFARWQAAGIALHLVVVGLFLTLAARLGAGWLGYAAAAFFALNFAVVETVMWSHINGYVLFLALELAAMILLHDALHRPPAWWRLPAAWGFLLAAAFTYEIGQFFAVIAAAVLAADAWGRGARRTAVVRFVAFAAVLLIYQAADRLDRLAHPEAHRDADYPSVLLAALSWNTGWQTVRYVLFTLVQPFVPSGITYSPHRGWDIHTRLGFSEPLAGWPVRLALSPLSAVSFAALGLVAARCLRLPEGRNRLFVILPLGLLGLHLGVTVLGRLNLRPDLLGCSTYYAYLPLLMALLAVLCCRPAARQDAALAIGFVALALVMGWQVSHLTKRVRDQVRPVRQQLQPFAELIRAHGHEPGFGIAVERDAVERMDHFHHTPLPMILYPRHVNADRPSHVIYLDGGRWASLPIAEHRQRRGDRALYAPGVARGEKASHG